jgi:DNA helicase IV
MDWHVLARRCPSRSITAVGDLAQRAAPAGARTWAQVLAPIAGDRFTLRALTVNYRTPAEIMEAAALALPEDERHRVPQSVRRTGEPPIHARLDELAALVDGPGTAAVITTDTGSLPGLDGFAVHTPGSAKGLEFDVVAVVDPEAIGAACPADLYVAMTRATRRLILVG